MLSKAREVMNSMVTGIVNVVTHCLLYTSGGTSGNLFSEYMVINGKLENVGDWEVDLTDYAKTAEVTAAIANALTTYAKTADVTKAINAAVAGLIQLGDLSVGTAGTGNVVTAVSYTHLDVYKRQENG